MEDYWTGQLVVHIQFGLPIGHKEYIWAWVIMVKQFGNLTMGSI